MANDIKQKIVLEGEKEYNRALAEAKRNLKTLRSELKAETAELGANATAQQKNETRIKSLRKQIEEQKKIVKTYQDALKEVKEKYGDNADAVAKWEQKLNESRTTLANMKNDLDRVGQGFKDVQGSADMATVATKSVADSFGKLSEIGDAISGSIENAFTGMLSTVKSAIGQIWGDIMDIAAKSDNYLDLASFFGSTAEDVQKWDSAMKGARGDLSTITGLIARLKYGGAAKKVTEWFGISDVNYENDLEYIQDVMQEMFEMKKEMSDGEWDKAMADIFGAKKVQDVDGVLSDWEDIVDGLTKFDPSKGGFGLSEKEISDMGKLSVQVATLQESWQKLKEMGEVKLFGKLSMDLTGNAQAIVDAMLEYLNADSDEEREAALTKIEENITAMFTRAAAAIEAGVESLGKVAEQLKSSENPTVQALGNVLSGLVDALKWLTEDNMKNVVNALTLLADFWLLGKGLKLATKLAEVVKNLTVIRSLGNLSNLAGAGGAGAGGATGILAGAGSALTGLGNKVTGFASGLLGKAGSWIGTNATAVWDWLTHNTGLAQEYLLGTKEKGSTFEEIGNNAAQWWTDYRNVLTNSHLYWKNISEVLKEAQEYAEQVEEELKQQEEVPQTVGPDENGFYPDWMSIEDIMNDIERRNQTNNGGNSGNTDGLTSADAKSMTGAVNQMPAAVARSLNGLRVVMDGNTVGRLVAPYVSQAIAQEIV